MDVPVIAIVDDDPSIRRSLHRLVQSAGYAVQTFASAREFLEWLPRGHAACLVLDVHMKEMSGFELQERLAVPVLFITSHDDVATRTRIETSGRLAICGNRSTSKRCWTRFVVRLESTTSRASLT